MGCHVNYKTSYKCIYGGLIFILSISKQIVTSHCTCAKYNQQILLDFKPITIH